MRRRGSCAFAAPPPAAFPSVVGAVGTLAAAQAPTADLTFKCKIDYRGRILDIDIDRIK